jgi:hypothetical protein
VANTIKIQGLRELNRSLKQVSEDLPKGVRVALNDAADVIVTDARSRFPRRSGRAAASLRARSTRTVARISEGGGRAPYVPWLDFGGRVGRGKSVRRAFLKEGRYLYAAYFDKREQFVDVMKVSIADLIRGAGLEVH